MKTTNLKKKAIIYCRVSSDEQAKGGSLKYQEGALKRYCENNGIEVVEVYKEDYSAKTFNRPEMNKICNKYLRKKKEIDADYLLVLRWNRFTRDASDGWEYISRFKKYGIEVNAIEEHLDFSVAESKIMLSVFLSMAEVDNDKRSKATKDGIHQALMEGKCAGHSPYGYVNKRKGKHECWVEFNDKEADLVKEAFKRVAYEVEVPTLVFRDLRKRGMELSESAFFRMLRNPFYEGKIFVPEYEGVPEQIVQGRHEPLIDSHTFALVQKRLSDVKKDYINIKKLPDNVFYLRGFMRCPVCGSSIYGSYSKGRKKKYPYYHCNHCGEFRMSAETVNENMSKFLSNIKPHKAVVALYERILSDLDKSNKNSFQENIKNLKKKLVGIEERIHNVQEKWFEGLLSDEVFNDMTQRLLKEKNESQLALEEHRKEPSVTEMGEKLNYAISFIENLGSCIAQMPIESKLRILGSIFSEKVVFENSNPRTAELSPLVSLITGKTSNYTPIKKKELSDSSESPVRGGWWVSNPRPTEPQSVALANCATATIWGCKYNSFFVICCAFLIFVSC